MSSNFKYTLTKVYKNYLKYVPELESNAVLRTIVQLCINYIESKTCSKEIINRAVEKIAAANQDVPEHIYELFSAILLLIQMYLRYPKGIVKDDELKETLKELRFAEHCTEDLIKVLHNHRDVLSWNYREMRNLRSPPKRMVWRINVNFVNRSTTPYPTVIIHIQKTDGEFQSFEINIAQFHRLRYNVALLLHELQSLDRRRSLKKM
ncbi:COMM domain-containing protein 5 [Sabethes cyaneus]|uniref:COMM domain-containing protein 5 n=1 Tax=Sabethes cyaneus TaxID=53552 RepID=UPI00237E33A2|nr:COMM domain-containing protein 5 [Sabethes cyaneus]